MIGACRLVGSWASGTRLPAEPSDGIHWIAPAGLFVCTQSKPIRKSRYIVVQAIGFAVQAPSRPLVIVSAPLPVPHLFIQPRPCCSTPAAAGSLPTQSSGLRAPCALPKVWPPAISATVSSSFMAMRPNDSRMSRAAASGSGLPFGPSGFT